MKRKELNKILSFLQEKRNYFISERNEFGLNSSPSFSSIEPYFEFDLMPLKVEVVANVTTQGELKTVKFYNSIIDLLNKDNFVDSYKDFIPNNKFEYYSYREAFLNHYNRDYPDNGLGEGEIEYINICFEGFLYSYQQVINEVILTIQTLISNHEAKIHVKEEIYTSEEKKQVETNDSHSIKQKFSDGELNEIIHKCINHLSGFNSRQEKIMEDAEYERLINATFELVKNNNPQKGINPFTLIGISGNSIIYSYYSIHSRIYFKGAEKNTNYINFLQNCFPLLLSNRNYDTIFGKFSTKPKKYPF